MSGKSVLIALAIVLSVIVVAALSAVGSYNGLIAANQAVQAQWGQVENVYQRRLDLVPNLVETVKGVAAFEKETYTAVAEARAHVGQVTAPGPAALTDDPAAFERFAQAQQGLSSALARLLVVSERYPQLKANESFRDLQAQLEGTENRIAVERMRYNDAARTYNTRRQTFPTALIAAMFADRFRERPYFEAQPGAAVAPKVKF